MKKVLLVDADRDSRAVYRHLLEHAGHDVLEAADAATALALARQARPALLITELALPGIGGRGLLGAVQRIPELVHMRTMVLTSGAQAVHEEALRAEGVSCVLFKPVPPTALVGEVARLLDAAPSGGG